MTAITLQDATSGDTLSGGPVLQVETGLSQTLLCSGAIFTPNPQGNFTYRVPSGVAADCLTHYPRAYAAPADAVINGSGAVVATRIANQWFADSFYDALYTNLENHTAQRGGQWTKNIPGIYQIQICPIGEVYSLIDSSGLPQRHQYFAMGIAEPQADVDYWMLLDLWTAKGIPTIIARGDGAGTQYEVFFNTGNNHIVMTKEVPGVETVLINAAVTFGAGRFHTLRFSCYNALKSVYWDGTLIGTSANNDIAGPGRGGLQITFLAGANSPSLGMHPASLVATHP